MNVPPVSVERVQKCVVNFEIYRFLKKAANLPHPPLTRALLGYFYNAPHLGGLFRAPPPSDLRNYWTDSKNSNGI